MKSKLFVFMFLYLISIQPLVYAEATCFPNDKNKICKDSFEEEGFFYCNIEDVESCENTCKIDLYNDDYCTGLLSTIRNIYIRAIIRSLHLKLMVHTNSWTLGFF